MNGAVAGRVSRFDDVGFGSTERHSAVAAVAAVAAVDQRRHGAGHRAAAQRGPAQRAADAGRPLRLAHLEGEAHLLVGQRLLQRLLRLVCAEPFATH